MRPVVVWLRRGDRGVHVGCTVGSALSGMHVWTGSGVGRDLTAVVSNTLGAAISHFPTIDTQPDTWLCHVSLMHGPLCHTPAGARLLPDEHIQRFVFAVASAVWAVSDSEATVRTLREGHRQHRLDIEMRRDARAAEGCVLVCNAFSGAAWGCVSARVCAGLQGWGRRGWDVCCCVCARGLRSGASVFAGSWVAVAEWARMRGWCLDSGCR